MASRSLSTKLAVLFATLSVLLVVVAVYLTNRLSDALVSGSTQAALDNPLVRSRVIDQLVARSSGAYDSHNDPDVGRVLLRNLDGRSHGIVDIDTNRFGMRELDYELPKPPNTVRVVILGDSFVFGTGAEGKDRMGVFLQSYIEEHGAFSGDVEVLHLGIMSWNIVAECAYLRRQVSLLQPDLVIHQTTGNDLDDVAGVRGFGSLAAFTPSERGRAQAATNYDYPRQFLEGVFIGPLLYAHDHESRTRYREARTALEELVRTVEAQGGEYLLLYHWRWRTKTSLEALTGGLEPSQIVHLSDEFLLDEAHWVRPDDRHWNRVGMEKVAKVLYAALAERDYLPALGLEPWPDAHAVYTEIQEQVRGAFDDDAQTEGRLKLLDAGLSCNPMTTHDAEQVYTGLDKDALVAPYAAFSLRSEGAERLHLKGHALDRPEMNGATVTVVIDDQPTGTFDIQAGQPIDATWTVPDELRSRTFVSVYLVADDWVYVGDDLQQCVVFQLESLAFE